MRGVYNSSLEVLRSYGLSDIEIYNFIFNDLFRLKPTSLKTKENLSINKQHKKWLQIRSHFLPQKLFNASLGRTDLKGTELKVQYSSFGGWFSNHSCLSPQHSAYVPPYFDTFVYKCASFKLWKSYMRFKVLMTS